MQEILQFPNRWLAWLWLVSSCHAAFAQVHRVEPETTIILRVDGATAAYSLDATLAEASADNGVVSISGKQPGTTHVVAVMPGGVQTFEVLIPALAPRYPPGFVMPVSAAEAAQRGYYEGRYYSSPAQIQNQFDFLKIRGNNRTRMHIVQTGLLGPLEPGRSRVTLSSVSYQIMTPRRDITLFDKYVDASQLTINGSTVRGFHMRQNNWFVHAGYTTVAAFEGLFLPTQRDRVAGGGYRQVVTANSSITASFYRVKVPAAHSIGQTGNIGTVSYKYSPRETFVFIADAGMSRRLGGAARLLYKTDRDDITVLARYVPLRFASLGSNNFRGFRTNLSWSRALTTKLNSVFSFYNNTLRLSNLEQTTISATQTIRYQIARHWALTAGAIASHFQTKTAAGTAVRSYTLPTGLVFQSRHFGATGQYQFAVTPGRETRGSQFRGSLRSGWRDLTISGYGQRDTNAPTLSFIYAQVAGLQQILDQQGIRATTVQQVDELLSNNSLLIAAGYIKGATINVVPVRIQLGGAATLSGGGIHQRQLSYSFILNDNRSLLGSSKNVGHTLSYRQRITPADDVSLACSVVGVNNPGDHRRYSPVCSISWRRQLQRVPYFIVPEKRGVIRGTVFRDDQSKGVLEKDMEWVSGAEVVLDGHRRLVTGADGSFRFANVSPGRHRIVATYHSRQPFFFTTASDVQADENAVVNFGIGYLLSGLLGTVLDDSGQGVGGLRMRIRNNEQVWNAVTEADGTFFVSSLGAGDYDVQGDESSLPPGYATSTFGDPQRVAVGSSSPGRAAFTVRAFRSISGQILSYAPQDRRYVAVTGAQVFLQETGLTMITDAEGRYLFRDLAAGDYTIAVLHEGNTSTRSIELGPQPIDAVNVDFRIGTRGPP